MVLLCCILLFVFTFGGRFGFFHQITLEAIGPFESFATSVSNRGKGVWSDYISVWSIRDEKRKQDALIAQYQEELGKYYQAYNTNLDLQKKLEFKKREPFPSLTARVVGRDPSYWFETIIVNMGINDGVMKGMSAMTENGVVGQIIQVSPNYAKILLANSSSSAIDAIIQKNRIRGILKGNGKGNYTLQYVLKNANAAVGDRVVTAGIGGIFPSDILLGKISAVHKQERGMFQEIEVAPSVDFQRLEVVFIRLNEKLSWEAEMKTGEGDEE